jgi:hypothetical protein
MMEIQEGWQSKKDGNPFTLVEFVGISYNDRINREKRVERNTYVDK